MLPQRHAIDVDWGYVLDSASLEQCNESVVLNVTLELWLDYGRCVTTLLATRIIDPEHTEATTMCAQRAQMPDEIKDFIRIDVLQRAGYLAPGERRPSGHLVSPPAPYCELDLAALGTTCRDHMHLEAAPGPQDVPLPEKIAHGQNHIDIN